MFLIHKRCPKCGQHYWSDEEHHCASAGAVVPVRPRFRRSASARPQAQFRRRALPEPEGSHEQRVWAMGPGPALPKLVPEAQLRLRIQALEREMEGLKRASDQLRGNDDQYEAALELLVKQVVELRASFGDGPDAPVQQPATSTPRPQPVIARDPYLYGPPGHRVLTVIKIAALAAAAVVSFLLARMLY